MSVCVLVRILGEQHSSGNLRQRISQLPSIFNTFLFPVKCQHFPNNSASLSSGGDGRNAGDDGSGNGSGNGSHRQQ